MDFNVLYEELYQYAETFKPVNTHSHHRPDDFFHNFDFNQLMKNTYAGISGVPLEDNDTSRSNFISLLKYRSNYVWLQKAIKELYSINEDISTANWTQISVKIKNAYQTKAYNIELLQNKCGYEKIILDAYWNPGDDNHHKELFKPTFRINMFMYGYSKTAKDHNGNNPQLIFDVDIDNLKDYCHFMKDVIVKQKQNGCVALKSGLAYDRGLDFFKTTKADAEKAFGKQPSEADIKAFQDYIFFEICAIAAELDLPFQHHTGFGNLVKTNGMMLHEAIVQNPYTKFVLFHGGYPWMSDICILSSAYQNVYPDLCWLALLSTSACKRHLHELIEVSNADKISWGCDTWTGEESYGALIAIRSVLATVCTEKIIDGYFSVKDAKTVIKNILYHNAKTIYKI